METPRGSGIQCKIFLWDTLLWKLTSCQLHFVHVFSMMLEFLGYQKFWWILVVSTWICCLVFAPRNDKQKVESDIAIVLGQAAAYYYHGMILDENPEDDSHAQGLACLQAAHAFLKEGQRARTAFANTAPITRSVVPTLSCSWLRMSVYALQLFPVNHLPTHMCDHCWSHGGQFVPLVFYLAIRINFSLSSSCSGSP